MPPPTAGRIASQARAELSSAARARAMLPALPLSREAGPSAADPATDPEVVGLVARRAAARAARDWPTADALLAELKVIFTGSARIAQLGPALTANPYQPP